MHPTTASRGPTRSPLAGPESVEDRLARVEDSLGRIEQALASISRAAEPVGQLAQDGPGLAALATDTIDRFAADVPDFDARLRGLLSLMLRATRPQTLEMLSKGLDAAESAPALAALATDAVDRTAGGIPDFDARLRALVGLTMRATRPETLAMLGKALDVAESAPQMVAAAVDVIDTTLGAAAREGVDVSAFLGVASRFALHIVKLGPAIDRLLDSGMLDPDVIDTLGQLGQSLAAETRQPGAPVGGLFAMLKVMKDPDVQRALGFGVGVARRFGADASTRDALPRPR